MIPSLQRYTEVMDAYLKGLEQRVGESLPVASLASVASFFVSRIDTKVDQRLQKIMATSNSQKEAAAALLGKAAIASARLAYYVIYRLQPSTFFNRRCPDRPLRDFISQ